MADDDDTMPEIEIKVTTLKSDGRTIKVPEELRWYPNEPNRGIGKRAVMLFCSPYHPPEDEEE